MLQIQLTVDAWDFNERPFLRAKRLFIKSHPQCQVCTEIIMDDSSDCDGVCSHYKDDLDHPWDFDHCNSDYDSDSDSSDSDNVDTDDDDDDDGYV